MTNRTDTTACPVATGMSTGGVTLKFTDADTTLFFNIYLQIGIVFTVLGVLSLCLCRNFLNYRLDRTFAFAYTFGCNKNNASVAAAARGTWWLGRAVQLILVLPFVMLMVWGGLLLQLEAGLTVALCTRGLSSCPEIL